MWPPRSTLHYSATLRFRTSSPGPDQQGDDLCQLFATSQPCRLWLCPHLIQGAVHLSADANNFASGFWNIFATPALAGTDGRRQGDTKYVLLWTIFSAVFKCHDGNTWDVMLKQTSGAISGELPNMSLKPKQLGATIINKSRVLNTNVDHIWEWLSDSVIRSSV